MVTRAVVGWTRSGDRSRPQTGDPHLKLMAAVLRAVIDDAFDAAARRSAMAYVDSTDRLWPFSFENLCEALDMNPDAVRRQLGLAAADAFIPVP